MECSTCKAPLSGNQKRFCSKPCSRRGFKRDHPDRTRRDLLVGASRRLGRLRRLLAELKSAPCTDCGIKYPPYVMDFDHVKGQKVRGVSQILRYGEAAMMAEIKKCELVCANCHRIRTHERRVVVGESG